MTHHLSLEPWWRWLADAREQGLWEEWGEDPGFHKRDPEDESPAPAPVEQEKRAA